MVSAWTTGQHVVDYVAAGDAQRASVELTVLGFGVALSCTAWRVRRGWQAKAFPSSSHRAMRARPGASA
ncbi:MAG: hypothetical protein ACOZE7_13230 [Pseudomonadota bacterium]